MGAGGIRTLGDGSMKANTMKKKHELEYELALFYHKSSSLYGNNNKYMLNVSHAYFTSVNVHYTLIVFVHPTLISMLSTTKKLLLLFQFICGLKVRCLGAK